MIIQGARAIKFQMGRMLFFLDRDRLHAFNTVPFPELIWPCGKLQTPLGVKMARKVKRRGLEIILRFQALLSPIENFPYLFLKPVINFYGGQSDLAN